MVDLVGTVSAVAVVGAAAGVAANVDLQSSVSSVEWRQAALEVDL